MVKQTKTTILLVEDDEDDIFAMRRALQRAGIVSSLLCLKDGQRAMDYLAGEGDFEDRERFPLPDVVFLDLRLPCMTGTELLAWMRQEPHLNGIPVVIFTAWAELEGRAETQAPQVLHYMVKPPTPNHLTEVLESLGCRTQLRE